MEETMNSRTIDPARCDRAEKEVNEGICLSYDMVKGLCLETMLACTALCESEDTEDNG
jgi:hypothetical protein